jgi:tRNA-binding protein
MAAQPPEPQPLSPQVQPEQFFAVDIRVGRVVRCEPFPEARKPAYKLLIDFGPLGMRRSSARIVDLYSPADVEGTLVVAVVNFPPRQVGPVRSEVLVLGTYVRGSEIVALLRPEGDVMPGDRVG